MRKSLVFSLALLLFVSPMAFAFETIPADHWAAKAVEDLHADGVLIGYPDGSFHGAQAATRYELAVALRRLENVVNGLAANAERSASPVNKTTTIVSGNPALADELAQIRQAVATLSNAQQQAAAADARRDKAISDLVATTVALDNTLKNQGTRLDQLEKSVADLKTAFDAVNAKLATVPTNDTIKGMVQAETAPFKDQIAKLNDTNAKLVADNAAQSKKINTLTWFLVGAGAVAVYSAVK